MLTLNIKINLKPLLSPLTPHVESHVFRNIILVFKSWKLYPQNALVFGILSKTGQFNVEPVLCKIYLMDAGCHTLIHSEKNIIN